VTNSTVTPTDPNASFRKIVGQAPITEGVDEAEHPAH
jgi:hypothetical protein